MSGFLSKLALRILQLSMVNKLVGILTMMEGIGTLKYWKWKILFFWWDLNLNPALPVQSAKMK